MPLFFHNLYSGISFVCLGAILLSALLIEIMIRAGIMDHPIARSSHIRPTPKGGGIGIISAFLLCLPLQRAACHLPLLDRSAALLLIAVCLVVSLLRARAAPSPDIDVPIDSPRNGVVR